MLCTESKPRPLSYHLRPYEILGRHTWLGERLRVCSKRMRTAAHHSSSSHDLTKEMWTPMERCRAAQSKQMKMPKAGDAHLGLVFLQSAHVCCDQKMVSWDRRETQGDGRAGNAESDLPLSSLPLPSNENTPCSQARQRACGRLPVLFLVAEPCGRLWMSALEICNNRFTEASE